MSFKDYSYLLAFYLLIFQAVKGIATEWLGVPWVFNSEHLWQAFLCFIIICGLQED